MRANNHMTATAQAGIRTPKHLPRNIARPPPDLQKPRAFVRLKEFNWHAIAGGEANRVQRKSAKSSGHKRRPERWLHERAHSDLSENGNEHVLDVRLPDFKLKSNRIEHATGGMCGDAIRQVFFPAIVKFDNAPGRQVSNNTVGRDGLRQTGDPPRGRTTITSQGFQRNSILGHDFKLKKTTPFRPTAIGKFNAVHRRRIVTQGDSNRCKR